MKKIMILLPNGYEEIEALTVVDFCRRAGIEIDMVSITGSIETTGDHGIVIKADKKIEDINPEDYRGVVTPGGITGTNMLRNDDRVISIIRNFFEEKKLIASICASPLVLQKAGIASQIRGTMYPNMESEVDFKDFVEQPVVVCDNVITSRGPATAIFFAYTIIDYLEGKESCEKIMKQTLAHYITK